MIFLLRPHLRANNSPVGIKIILFVMSRFFKRLLLSSAIVCTTGIYSANAQSYLNTPRTYPSINYNSDDLNFAAAKVKQTLFYLSNFYLDTVNVRKVTDETITKIMQQFDPHSVYITAKDVDEMEEPLVGNFDGIGVEYAIINDSLSVQSVIPGGPSEKVGLHAGDKIVKVNGEEICGTHLTTKRVLGYLRGDRGTKVNIAILRRGVSGEIDVTITRDKIPLNTVDAAYEISNGIMMIRISRFGAETYKEMIIPVKQYISAHKGKLKGIILDLRGNPGGYLETALTIANEFLDKGQLILYTEGRAVKRTDDLANGDGILKNVPLALLIDESSASASEIVAGAIQDWDRGTIIGRRSFGKGLVQQEFPLQDGGRLRMTIARYHTPSGRVIQSPYENGEADKYYENVIKRYLSDERFNKDSIKINDSLKFKTLKKGRVVYGGGGIIPDVFMPVDTSFYSKSYIKCVNKGIMTDFVNIYTDNHRKEFDAQYKNMEQFAKNYKVPDSYWNEFLAYSKAHGVEFTATDLKASGEEIRKNLKGLIIRALYGLDGYLKYDYSTDPEVQKALEVLK